VALSQIQHLKNKAKLLQKAKAKAGKPMALKDALEIIAQHASFASWRELKENFDANAILVRHLGSSVWNVWYSSYKDALRDLNQRDGRYLLPYQRQFFICDIHYINRLNIDVDDADLKLVGNNWVEPKDPVAWDRLLKKMK
jgi:glyoxalase superfamily protein